MSERRDSLDKIAVMRRVLDFLAESETALSEGFYIWSNEIQISFYGDNAKTQMAEMAREIRQHFGIKESRKNGDNSTFVMSLTVPDSYYEFKLYTPRENVCRKVETGETVTKTRINYQTAPREEYQEPVIRWECDPILGE